MGQLRPVIRCRHGQISLRFALFRVSRSDAFIAFSRQLQARARDRHCRYLLALCGSPRWGRASAAMLRAALSPDSCLWLGPDSDGGASPVETFDGAFRHLGRETGMLVYDAHGGFDPDAFAASTGSLVGGGLMLLLIPPWASWPEAPDPQKERLAVYPVPAAAVKSRFLSRLARILRFHEAVVTVSEGEELPPLPAASSTQLEVEDPEASRCRTRDQAEAVSAVIQTATGHRRRPLVLTADRGRGKSAALGIAAAELFGRGFVRVLVTGPRRAAVDALFSHAARLLPGAEVSSVGLKWQEAELRFVAPDALLAQGADAELVLVDEAAALPAALLSGLLDRYARIVFSTTVHGYEGSGRGFSVRFRDVLDCRTPQWRSLSLDQPIRWAPDDPLETLVFRALLLDAEPADGVPLGVAPDDYEVTRLSRDELAENEPLLTQVFGLLVVAHYRTTPLDLRHLLDGPNLQVWVARRGNRLLGVLLAAEEGGIEESLAREIWAGRRRPRGHLVPQALAVQLGLEDAPLSRGMRVIRVAVHPLARRRGVGTALVKRLCDAADARGMDFVGALFSGSPPVLAFWRRTGMQPLWVGTKRETSTGAHSVLVAAGISPRGHALVAAGQDRYARDLPWSLGDALRDLEPALVEELTRGLRMSETQLTGTDLRLLEGFAFGRRSFEATGAVLHRAVSAGMDGALPGLDPPMRDALVARVLQHRSWQDTAREIGVSGRAEVIEILRRAAVALLEVAVKPEGKLMR